MFAVDHNISIPDVHANKGPLALWVSICMTPLAIIAVTLRFISRRLSPANYWWDDWFILATLPWTLGLNICQFYAYHHGLGQHVAVLPSGATETEYKVTFWFELIYVMGIGLNKYSILFFYRRLFPGRTLLLLLQTVGGIVLIWQIAMLPAFIWQCKPVQKAWDVTMPGTCIEVIKLWLGNAIPNIVTDLVIIAIPLPLVWRLRISLSQRIAVCGLFLTGFFVCAVSICRLVAILHAKEEDPTCTVPSSSVEPSPLPPSKLDQATANASGAGNFTDVAIWSAVESSIGVVCACLPSIYHLLKMLLASIRQLVQPVNPLPVSPSPSAKSKWPFRRRSLDHIETESSQGMKGDYSTWTREWLKDSNTSVPLNVIRAQDDIEQNPKELERC